MSQLAQSRELRRHLRVDYRRRVWCEHSEWTQYLTITNLSDGGLFIQTPTPFKPGERLRVSFADEGRIVLEVEVVRATRVRQGGVGCQVVAFLEGEARYADLLARLASSAR
jgi:Tfp pilus assembly protein PilZ